MIFYKDYRKIPNIISIVRIFLALPLTVCFLYKNYHLAIIISSLAMASDFLDGYIARRFSCKSEFGAFIDPLSDKVFCLCLTILLWSVGSFNILDKVLVILIFFRDTLISVLRFSKDISVVSIAKYKTTLYMLGLNLYIINQIIACDISIICTLFILASCCLSMLTLYSYITAYLN